MNQGGSLLSARTRITGVRWLLLAAGLALAAILLSGFSPQRFVVSGTVSAGPTCPSAPSDPAGAFCPPMFLEGIHLTIVQASGPDADLVVAQPVSDERGAFSAQLPAGRYRIQGEYVPGSHDLSPIFFDVGGTSPPMLLSLRYDTGIR